MSAWRTSSRGQPKLRSRPKENVAEGPEGDYKRGNPAMILSKQRSIYTYTPIHIHPITSGLDVVQSSLSERVLLTSKQPNSFRIPCRIMFVAIKDVLNKALAVDLLPRVRQDRDE